MYRCVDKDRCNCEENDADRSALTCCEVIVTEDEDLENIDYRRERETESSEQKVHDDAHQYLENCKAYTYKWVRE